jgi:hypothetical protein
MPARFLFEISRRGGDVYRTRDPVGVQSSCITRSLPTLVVTYTRFFGVRYYCRSTTFIQFNPSFTRRNILMMLFTRLAIASILSLSIGTLAAPIPEAEAAAAKSIFEIATDRATYEVEKLSAKLNDLQNAQGQNRNGAAIEEQVGHVVHALSDGAADMRAARTATTAEVAALLGSLNSLTSATNEGARRWVRIKPTVYQMNGQQNVIGLLGKMKNAGAAFSTEMNQKMPLGTQTVGKVFYADVVEKTMSDLIREYQTAPRGGSTNVGWF